MTKQLFTTLSVSLSVLVLGAFSIGNALALTAAEGEIPLTSPIQFCKDATESLQNDIENIKASALSLQLSKAEITAKIQTAKQYKNSVCDEAKELKQSVTASLSNPIGLCRTLTSTLTSDIETIKAQGLSLQLSRPEIAAKIKAAKESKKQICEEAKEYKEALGWK